MTPTKANQRLKEFRSILEGLKPKKSKEINMFTAFHLQNAERHHSFFFAGLLAPGNPHRLGKAPIEKFLYYLWDDTVREENYKPRKGNPVTIKSLPNTEILRTVAQDRQSLIDLSQGNISVETEVYTNEKGKQSGYIDILVKISAKDEETASSVVKTVIVIENKTGTETHSDQLRKYEDYIDAVYPGSKKIFVLISPLGNIPVNHGGDEQYNDRYCIFDYGNERGVCKILEELIDELDTPQMKTRMTYKQKRKIKMILEDYMGNIETEILGKVGGEANDVYAKLLDQYPDLVEGLVGFYNGANPSKVANYCKEKLNAESAGNSRSYFYTEEMKKFFERHGEEIGNKMRIVCQKGNTAGKKMDLWVELNIPKNASPAQQILMKDPNIQALQTGKPSPATINYRIIPNHPFLTKDEIAESDGTYRPFDTVRPVIDKHLQDFSAKLQQLENILKTL